MRGIKLGVLALLMVATVVVLSVLPSLPVWGYLSVTSPMEEGEIEEGGFEAESAEVGAALYNKCGTRTVFDIGGDVYVVVRLTGGVGMFKKNGGAFAEQDAGDRPAMTNIPDCDSRSDGTLIHVAYYGYVVPPIGGEYSVRYVTFDTSTDQWGTPEDIYTDIVIYGGTSVAVSLDSNDKPHVVYMRRQDGDNFGNLKYKNKVGVAWSAEEDVSGSDKTCRYHTVDHDSDNRLVVVWENFTGVDIEARSRSSAGVWDAETTVRASSVEPSLTIDQYDQKQVALTGGDVLMCATGDAGANPTWSVSAFLDDDTMMPSIAAEECYLFIIYQELVLDDILMVYYTPVDGWSDPVTLQSDVGGDTLNHAIMQDPLSSDRFHYIWYNDTENAVYWDEYFVSTCCVDIMGNAPRQGTRAVFDVSGVPYVVVNDGESVRMYKMDGCSFVEQDDADAPVADIVYGCDARFDGTLVHIVYRDFMFAGAEMDVVYVTFDTSTDQWGIPEAVYDDIPSSAGASQVISLDSNDKPHVIYSYGEEIAAVFYAHLKYKNKVGAVWSVEEDVHPTDEEVNRVYTTLGHEGDDRLVVVWENLTASNVGARTRTSAGVWDTEGIVRASSEQPSLTIGVDDRKRVALRSTVDDLYCATGTAGANPSWSVSASLDGSVSSPSITEGGAKLDVLYIIYTEYALDDIMMVEEVCDSWSAPVALEAGADLLASPIAQDPASSDRFHYVWFNSSKSCLNWNEYMFYLSYTTTKVKVSDSGFNYPGVRSVFDVEGVAYVVSRDIDAIEDIAVHKRVGCSFVEQDSGDRPGAASNLYCVDSRFDGTLIHIVYYEYDGVDYNVRYVTFDTSTDQWGAPEDVKADLNAATVNHSCAISLDSNNKPHVAYVESDKIAGTNWDHLKYKNKTGAVWSAEEEISPPGEAAACISPSAGHESDDRFVVVWRKVQGVDVECRTRSDGGVWDNITLIYGFGMYPSITIGNDDKKYVAIVSTVPGGLFCVTGTTGANPVWTDSGNLETLAVSDPSITKGGPGDCHLYILYEQGGTGDIYVVERNGTWSKPILIQSRVTGEALDAATAQDPASPGRINYIWWNDASDSIYWSEYVFKVHQQAPVSPGGLVF